VGDYTNIKGFKFDVIIVAPGLISAIESAFEFVKSGGRVILFAPTKPGEVLPLDVNKIYFDEITIIPSYSAGPDDMRLALEILDRVKPSRLITHRIKLQNIAEGFKIAKTPEALKVMVDL
ncbi:MAG: hypothetical protein ABIL23_07045, partial [candidate division WOR-3 bacterium]